MEYYNSHVIKYCQQSILFDSVERMVVHTGKPFANMMHDGSRPFAVCQKLGDGRARCIGRYDGFGRAKAALKYLK